MLERILETLTTEAWLRRGSQNENKPSSGFWDGVLHRLSAVFASLSECRECFCMGILLQPGYSRNVPSDVCPCGAEQRRCNLWGLQPRSCTPVKWQRRRLGLA